MKRISVDSNGIEGNGNSRAPDISGDGRYVIYNSLASNLVDDDGNGNVDVFLYDAVDGTTRRLADTGLSKDDDLMRYRPAIAAGGDHVTFASRLRLDQSDQLLSSTEIFRLNIKTDQVDLVSFNAAGAPGGGANGIYSGPDISSDGRYVVFHSRSKLTTDDLKSGKHHTSVYLFDADQNQNTLLDIDQQQSNVHPKISPDGNVVAYADYQSTSNNNHRSNLYTVATGQTVNVSVSDTGAATTNATAGGFSQDGRYILFNVATDSFVTGDNNGRRDVVRVDRNTGAYTIVSVASDGTQGNGDSGATFTGLSADGRFAVFSSSASNLVDGDTNGMTDVFVHDLQTRRTKRVSVADDGTDGDNNSTYPVISGDGRYVSFYSDVTNLVSGDTNGRTDIFLTENPLFAPVNATTTGTEFSTLTPAALDDDRLDGTQLPSAFSDGDEQLTIAAADHLTAAGVAAGGGGTDRLVIGFDGDADLTQLGTMSGFEQLVHPGGGDLVLSVDAAILAGALATIDLGAGTGDVLAVVGGGSVDLSSALASLTGVETIRGDAAAADSIAGSAQDDAIEGLGGDDSLAGGAGADTLVGGAGDDRLDPGAAGDRDILVFEDVSTGAGGTDRVVNYSGNGGDGDLIDFAALSALAGTGVTADGFVALALDGAGRRLTTGFATVVDGSGAGRTAAGLAADQVAAFLADVDGTGNGVRFADDDAVVLIALGDGSDTGLFLADDADGDPTIAAGELTEVVRLVGMSDPTAIGADQLPDFRAVMPQIAGGGTNPPAGGGGNSGGGGGGGGGGLGGGLFAGGAAAGIAGAVDAGLTAAGGFRDIRFDGVDATVGTANDRTTGETVSVIVVNPADGPRTEADPTSPDVDIPVTDRVRVSLSETTGLIATSRRTSSADHLRSVLGGSGGGIGDPDLEAFLTMIAPPAETDGIEVLQIIPVDPDLSGNGTAERRLTIDMSGTDEMAVVVLDVSSLTGAAGLTVQVSGRAHLVVRGPGGFLGTEALGADGNLDSDNILGDDDDQSLFFGAGPDTIRGGGGDGTVASGDGNDWLDGGTGNDLVRGGADHDTLVGGAGDDALDGEGGRDLALFSGALADLAVTGSRAATTVTGNAGTGTDTLAAVELLVAGGRSTVTGATGGTIGFNERAYLDAHPDVAAAVAAGRVASGADHFAAFGETEGRAAVDGSIDAAFYLEVNADVAAAVEGGTVASAAAHFLTHGLTEGRDPTPLFDGAWYLDQYADVAAAVAAGRVESAFDHFQSFGAAEGRAASPWFDTAAYLAENQDVAVVGLNPLDHFLAFGVAEGRSGLVTDPALV